MDTLYISNKDWESFIRGKIESRKIFAPFDFNGTLFYAKITAENADDIVYNRARPVEPLKLFLFPFKERVSPSVEGIGDIVVMGPAACDLKGLEILDRVFKDGDYKDPCYAERREKTLIISFDCASPYPVCFCELVGLHPYPEGNFDLNVSRIPEGFLVDIGSDKGRVFIGEDQKFFQITDELRKKRDEGRRKAGETIKELNRDFDFTNIENLKGACQTELWRIPKEVENCVQCGSCTNNCPTCVCFLLEDTGNRKEEMRKTKVWDSCLFPGYARMAAGASPRPTLYDRYANRLLCKYWYMVENFGMKGCTGCGRCIAGCAGKIDKRRVITEVLREKEKV
ncbi:MAG: 4Fe-4S dicluster domain-containing protein [Candidatus Omnitrophica bacterium]|nr:4Fe-4S dicluster domain-containing protein [Candidatus Omnitrophota bacterium]